MLLSQCPWKEYTTEAGKIYYHNINTQESRWVIPSELEEIKKRIAEEPASLATPVVLKTESLSPAVGSPVATDSPTGNKSALEAAMAATLAAIAIPTSPKVKEEKESKDAVPESKGKQEAIQPPLPIDGQFKDRKEAMEAFKELLRDCNVPSNATWEHCTRLIQNDPR